MLSNRNMLGTEVGRNPTKGDAFNFEEIKLIILHALYIALMSVYSALKLSHKLALKILRGFSKLININQRQDAKKIFGDVELSKVPSHVTYVIHDDTEADYNRLADLVQWSIIMGVKFITIVTDSRKFDDNLFRKTALNCLDDAVQDKCSFHLHSLSQERISSINIIHTSVKNTRKQFICNIQRICGSNDSSHQMLSLKTLHNILNEADNGLPDPELLVSFGQYYSFYGFKPWHLRLTEIIHCSNLASLSPNLFMNWFVRYSSCQQRLGS